MSYGTATFLAQLMTLYGHWALRWTIYIATATTVALWATGEPMPAGLGAGGWLLLCGALWTIYVMQNTIRMMDSEIQILEGLGNLNTALKGLREEIDRQMKNGKGEE